MNQNGTPTAIMLRPHLSLRPSNLRPLRIVSIVVCAVALNSFNISLSYHMMCRCYARVILVSFAARSSCVRLLPGLCRWVAHVAEFDCVHGPSGRVLGFRLLWEWVAFTISRCMVSSKRLLDLVVAVGNSETGTVPVSHYSSNLSGPLPWTDEMSGKWFNSYTSTTK